MDPTSIRPSLSRCDYGPFANAQQRVQRILDELVASGNDRGLQVAVYHQGELIVDAHAGYADAGASRLVDGGTLFPVFSCGKGVAATAVHLLGQRGVLDDALPLAAYWPEFAEAGKQDITLRHALTHTAGMWHVPPGREMVELCDWDAMCRKLAKQAPMTRAGEVCRYHAVTYGWLVGEPARRADGRTFDRIVREEVCQPLGIADDIFFGVPDAQRPRVATLETHSPARSPEVEDPAFPNFLLPTHDLMNHSLVQAACIPGFNAIATARALARHYAALLPGGIDGVELLLPETRHRVTRLNRPTGEPSMEPPPVGYGLGYKLIGPPEDRSCIFGHAGHGGTIGFADTRHRLAVAVTKNTLNAPRSAVELVTKELMRMLPPASCGTLT